MNLRIRQWIPAVSAIVSLCAATAPALAQDYEKMITRAYDDVLGRKPDPSGMRTYRSKMIDEGWNEKDVRNDLRKSAEFRVGDVDVVIRRAYEDLLGRKPDKSGLEMYRKRMLEDRWDERRVRDDIRKSEEYRKKNR